MQQNNNKWLISNWCNFHPFDLTAEQQALLSNYRACRAMHPLAGDVEVIE